MENDRVELLDHGYLQFIERWGGDDRIIEAARMSTGKGFLGWGPITRCKHCRLAVHPNDPNKWHPYVTQEQMGCEHERETVSGDEKLLRYLYENRHSTPFEMAGMVIEVQAPIMVFREWHRHRTQSFNEMSARYIPLPNDNYVPTNERLLINSKTNKQAGVIKGADELTEDKAEWFRQGLEKQYEQQQKFYEEALQAGVSKELARLHIGVGRYSRMRASANLRNWLAFLTLRMDTKVQWEIRMYANEVGSLIAKLFPRTWKLFAESL